MHKVDFLTVLEKAITENKGIAVLIQNPELPDFEVISNPAVNLPMKKEYYEEAYDDMMRLKHNPSIGIVKVELV